MGSSLRVIGGGVGFGFGVVWMTVGLGPAIVCVLLAALGYGAVFMAERNQADRRSIRIPGLRAPSAPTDEFGLGDEVYEELPDDATTPLAAEAEYGWPWPTGDREENAERDPAPVTGERT